MLDSYRTIVWQPCSAHRRGASQGRRAAHDGPPSAREQLRAMALGARPFRARAFGARVPRARAPDARAPGARAPGARALCAIANAPAPWVTTETITPRSAQLDGLVNTRGGRRAPPRELHAIGELLNEHDKARLAPLIRLECDGNHVVDARGTQSLWCLQEHFLERDSA